MVVAIRTPGRIILCIKQSVCVQGYLKISIQVIGPGDEPKSPPSDIAQETVDIEA